jgi:hypothetical protein
MNLKTATAVNLAALESLLSVQLLKPSTKMHSLPAAL